MILITINKKDASTVNLYDPSIFILSRVNEVA